MTHSLPQIERTMKPIMRTLLVALLLAITAPSAVAQVEWSSGVDFMSPYVWRGQVFSNGFVFQPYVEAAYQGLAVGFWGNVDPQSEAVDSKMHLNEADLYASYSASLGGVALSLGYTFYTFPDPTGETFELWPTHEFSLSAALEAVPLSPSLFVAYDVDAIQGMYAEAGLGHEVNLGSQPFGLGFALGFDNEFLLEDSGLSHMALSVGTAFEAGNVTVSPLIGFQIQLADEYRAFNAPSGFGSDTFFYGGIGLGF